jgi:glucose-6-phosphate 1-dehydrogenase
MADEGSNNTADLLVIFGITGDLARKMTLRALYRLECRKLLDCPILGVASRERSDDELHQLVRQAISPSGEGIDEEVFNRFTNRLSYVFGDVTGHSLYAQLAQRVRGRHLPLYYLETPPSLFGPIVEHLGKAELVTHARVAVEKPFGYDLRSARELDAQLHQVLREDQILRVDHLLGKEPVMELEYLRFANLAMAEIWDRKSISAVQITMAEDFGVEDRGRFYDPVGALRDVVQNHLLQVLALVAMEPPAGGSAEELQDKKAEVFRAMPAADPHRYVRGQYEGYLEVPGVAQGSTTETFVALQLEIDNWRWAGVPIFLRAGKELPYHVTEVRLLLRPTPRLAFLPNPTEVDPNQIVLRIDPDAGLRLQIITRADDSWRSVHLDTQFRQELGEPWEPYERVLHAALIGDHQLFARQDSIEETWRIVQPLLDHPPDVQPYPRGSWGPPGVESFCGHYRWQKPWLASEHA